MKELIAVYRHVENGTQYDQEDCSKYLHYNSGYMVKNVMMGQSHTSITLENIDGVFNSVMFDFYLMENGVIDFTPYDISSDPDYNPYLKRENV